MRWDEYIDRMKVFRASQSVVQRKHEMYLGLIRVRMADQVPDDLAYDGGLQCVDAGGDHVHDAIEHGGHARILWCIV